VDLIVKPRTIELDLWINVYPDGAFIAFTTREVADGLAGSSRIACISLKRTVTEGEGL
jgi:L-ribulose-5-phosphate 3-epimerase UlaE